MSDAPRRPLAVTLSVEGMPEVLSLLRRDMARLLREVAQDEGPDVAARLHAIAAAFETGLEDVAGLDEH